MDDPIKRDLMVYYMVYIVDMTAALKAPLYLFLIPPKKKSVY
jgi:hypothetical protein